MLQLQKIAQVATTIALLAAGVEAQALQHLPLPGTSSNSTLQAGCGDCDASVRAASMPSSIAKIAEVAQSEEFKNRTIFYKDDLVAKSRAAGSEFAPFGAIQDMTSKEAGSVTLIPLIPGLPGACHLLTFRHMVRTTAEMESRKHEFTFRVAFGPRSNNRPMETVVTAAPIAWGSYEDSAPVVSEDFMILSMKPEDCAKVAKYGTVDVSPVSPRQIADASNRIVKAGHTRSKDWNQGVWVDESCSIKDPSGNGNWLHDCAALTQDSGGGLLYRQSNNKLTMVCMQSRIGLDSETPEANYSSRLANQCVSLSTIYSKLGTQQKAAVQMASVSK